MNKYLLPLILLTMFSCSKKDKVFTVICDEKEYSKSYTFNLANETISSRQSLTELGYKQKKSYQSYLMKMGVSKEEVIDKSNKLFPERTSEYFIRYMDSGIIVFGTSKEIDEIDIEYTLNRADLTLKAFFLLDESTNPESRYEEVKFYNCKKPSA